MSYSVSVTAKDKADAKAKIVEKIDEVVAQQPAHAKDRDAIIANANACLDLITDDPNMEVKVSMNGSTSWQQAEPDKLYGVGISCSIHLSKKTE